MGRRPEGRWGGGSEGGEERGKRGGVKWTEGWGSVECSALRAAGGPLKKPTQSRDGGHSDRGDVMFDTIKAGETIKCMVVKSPRTADDTSTLRRLMRFDDDIKRRLKKAQESRMNNLYVRSRGKRPWEVRRKASLMANPERGATWTMRYFPHVAPDFRSVAEFIKVEKA